MRDESVVHNSVVQCWTNFPSATPNANLWLKNQNMFYPTGRIVQNKNFRLRILFYTASLFLFIDYSNWLSWATKSAAGCSNWRRVNSCPGAHCELALVFIGWREHALLVLNINDAAVYDRPRPMAPNGDLFGFISVFARVQLYLSAKLYLYVHHLCMVLADIVCVVMLECLTSFVYDHVFLRIIISPHPPSPWTVYSQWSQCAF